MKCDKQCSYRTPYGYCSVTKCQTNLGTTYAEPRHLKKDVSEEYIWRINDDGTDAKIQKIVRCKDCKYSREAMPMVKGQYECGYVLGVRTANDFCSRGEKR